MAVAKPSALAWAAGTPAAAAEAVAELMMPT